MLTAGVVALAVLAAIASPVFAVFAVFFAVFAFLFDYSAVRSWGDFTQVRPDGIRTRRRGRVYDWPWAEVADISQDWVNGKAGATRFVVLTTTADEEFRLGAPMLFGAKRRSADLFLEQFGRITAAWKSATGAASPRANGLTASDQGLTGPQADSGQALFGEPDFPNQKRCPKRRPSGYPYAIYRVYRAPWPGCQRRRSPNHVETASATDQPRH